MKEKKKYITLQTDIGWLAAEIKDESKDRYICVLGDGKKYEVLKAEITFDEDGEMHAMYW